MADAGPNVITARPPFRYALVDLARAPQLLSLVDGLDRIGAAQCLFEGRIAPALRRVAPFIVALDRAPQLWMRWRAEGRGACWASFVETAMPMADARRHFRRFMQVRLADGSGPVMLRIWDPRVLSIVLRHGDGGERSAILGGDIALTVEIEGEPDLLERHDDTGVRRLGWHDLAASSRQAMPC